MLIPNGELVAVYGTLRAGCGNHRVIEGAIRQEDGVVAGLFEMFSLGGFPALTHSDTPHDIVVEVYEVNNEAHAQGLDWLEGYPTFYDREVVTLVDGRKCWSYFIDPLDRKQTPIPSGDWVKFTNDY
jgi:gamma-glutamylcyclotransferase (GGCT)/AIG2-like uncharacterized protein YtfP